MASQMKYSRKPVAIMCFSSGGGGMERSAVRLAHMLSKVANVVLICKKNSYVEKLYCEVTEDFPCESVDFTSRVFSPLMLIRARHLVNKYNIGNVIFMGASELKTLFFSFLGLKINMIVWHGTTKSKPKRDFIHNLVYSNVNYHVVLSEHLLRNVKDIVPLTPRAIFRIIRPVPDFEISVSGPGCFTNKIINIIHVGRIAAGKGQVDAVLACKSLRDAGIKFTLTLVGGADDVLYMQQVDQAIYEADLSDVVYLSGYVNNVKDFLEKADILLFPSRGEGMPSSLIEALHYNIVCIVYKNTVFLEFVEMGFNIHLVTDGNVADLSAVLLAVVRNLHTEKEKTTYNIELSRKYFQVDREISEWLDILV